MGEPDLIHLLRSPYWWLFLVVETALMIAGLILSSQWPGWGEMTANVLWFIACLVFSILSFGIVFSPSFRSEVVRPGALYEQRHQFFLFLGGLGALVGCILIVVDIIKKWSGG